MKQHDHRTSRLALLAAATTLALAGCDKAEQAPPAGTAEAIGFALEQRVDTTIVPTIKSFADVAGELDAATETFCAEPDAEGLTTAQERWNEASAQWSRAVLYNFGPLNDDIFAPRIYYIESMRQRGIDYSAKVRHEIDRQLAAENPLDAGHFKSLRQNQTGLLPLEILLFESTLEGHPQTTEAILADFQEHPRKCDYLTGIANRLGSDAAYVESGWTEAFKDSELPYRDHFVSGRLESGATPLAVLFTSIQDHLDYLKRRKLDGTLDARLSGRFYANTQATLDELQQLVGGEHGFLAQAEARDHEQTAAAIRQTLEAAITAAESENRAVLTKQIDTLWTLLREDLPEALEVKLGLNFSDGD